MFRSTHAFLSEQSTTILVSGAVFTVLSVVMSAMTRDGTKPAAVSADTQLKIKPRPNWALLQALNYVVLAIFVGSIGYVIANYRPAAGQAHYDGNVSPMTNMFFPMMITWSLCLAYFFGFFGISFVDKESLESSPSSFGLSALDEQDYSTSKEQQDSNKKAQSSPARKQSSGSIPVPMNDTPICAERGCKAPTSTSTSSPAPTPATVAAVKADGPEPDYSTMTDDEVLECVRSGLLKDYALEKKLGDKTRAVLIRRKVYEETLGKSLDAIPYTGYDYDKVFGANCEIVVGYVPLPVGIVGPLMLNGAPVYIPMATTEGCLVASTNRGCKALSMSGGCQSVLLKDAITRAPCVRLPSAVRAAALKKWAETRENYLLLEEAFNSTTNYGRLDSLTVTVAGRNAYLRFSCMSGDAMGMNMVSKGCLKAIEVIEGEFPDMVLVAISGNMCTDKKPSAINWILGRGKSVVVEAVIPEKIVVDVLKTTVKAMVDTNKQKNLVGSAMAGSVGGFNAHASNIVTAVFLATGQDPAQNVESSNCLTMMDFADDEQSLHVSVTMPSVEVGTVGGGTHLPAQAGCLEICGVRGVSKAEGSVPGDNARQLAQIVAASVLAGELSLMAALAANHLVRSHMQHNRKTTPSEPTVSAATDADASAAVETSVPSVTTVEEGAVKQGLARKHASMPELSQ